METESLKRKSIIGTLWSFIETFSLKLIQFIINVIMARLLMPEDYGVITIVYTLIVISQVFIDGGFATTLIQDKHKSEKDYSTIFTFNVFVSILCYLLLFSIAPLLSEFYNTDIILPIRVLSLNLILSAFVAIHRIKLTVAVNFKMLAKVNVISAAISGILGVWGAYNGYGVWALIFQYLSNGIVSSFLLIVVLKWKPICFFNPQSFKRLFPFGARLLLANLIDRIYMNLYPIFVGKLFSASSLGYYSRAEQFAALPANTCLDIFLRVTFPVMSSITDESQIVKIYRKYVSLSSFLIFPVIFLVIVISKPLILILLTDKWETIILMLQILCVGFVFDHISAINRNLLYVKGRADLALKLEIIKKVIATLILFVSIPFGLIGLCIGKAIYGVLAMILNSWYTRSLINVSLGDQIKDFSPSLSIVIISALIAYIPVYTLNSSLKQFIVGCVVFMICFLCLSSVFKLKEYRYSMDILKQALSR